MNNDFYMFQEVRQLRNACAHSNCILNDLRSNATSNYSPDYKLMHALSEIREISHDVRKHKLSNDRIRQITTLLYLYHYYVLSSGLQTHHTMQLHETFIYRFGKHLDYYSTAQPVYSAFEFFRKIIDNWFPKAYNEDIVQKPQGF